MMFELARKHGLSLPYVSVETLREAYRFTNLQSFLDVYYEGTAVLREAGDFHGYADARVARSTELS